MGFAWHNKNSWRLLAKTWEVVVELLLSEENCNQVKTISKIKEKQVLEKRGDKI